MSIRKILSPLVIIMLLSSAAIASETYTLKQEDWNLSGYKGIHFTSRESENQEEVTLEGHFHNYSGTIVYDKTNNLVESFQIKIETGEESVKDYYVYTKDDIVRITHKGTPLFFSSSDSKNSVITIKSNMLPKDDYNDFEALVAVEFNGVKTNIDNSLVRIIPTNKGLRFNMTLTGLRFKDFNFTDPALECGDITLEFEVYAEKSLKQ